MPLGPAVGSAKRTLSPGGSGPASGPEEVATREPAAKRACVATEGSAEKPTQLKRQARVTRKQAVPVRRMSRSRGILLHSDF